MPKSPLTRRRATHRRDVHIKTDAITHDIGDADALRRLDAVATLKGTTRTAILASLVATALGPRFTKHITAA